MHRVTFLIGLAVLVLLPPSTGFAHHFDRDDVDTDSALVLQGFINEVEWVNPHVTIHLIVEMDNGLTRTWQIQADSPNTLLRRGINRASYAYSIESRLVFTVYPSRSAACNTDCFAYGLDFTDPNGFKRILMQDLEALLNSL